jgi:hypothetical protein
MIWGQELDYQSFGRSLYELAIRHGYLQAEEKIFAADGGPAVGGRLGMAAEHHPTASHPAMPVLGD